MTMQFLASLYIILFFASGFIGYYIGYEKRKIEEEQDAVGRKEGKGV